MSDDYDSDGNNIVPCQLCMENHYGAECPEELKMQVNPEYADQFFSMKNKPQWQERIAKQCRCGDAFRKRNMEDPLCQVHDLLPIIEEEMQKQRESLIDAILFSVKDTEMHWGGACDGDTADYVEGRMKEVFTSRLEELKNNHDNKN